MTSIPLATYLVLIGGCCWTAGIQPAHGLFIRSLEGPNQVHRGADMILHCKYDLEGCPLYAVKWFRGSREFFRFEPERWPRASMLFPLDSVHVDIESSGAERLVIRHVQLAATGTYRCEVTVERTFETDYREINVTVVDAPLGDPVIEHMRAAYAEGDELNINCTSFESRPAARLEWIINGQPASALDTGYVQRYPTRWSSGHPPMETSTIGLRIGSLQEHHFRNGKMSVICTASVDGSYRKFSQVRAGHSLQPPHANLLRPAVSDKRRSFHYPTGGGGRAATWSWLQHLTAVLSLLLAWPRLHGRCIQLRFDRT